MIHDLRQTENYANYMRSIGWIVEQEDNVNYAIRPFPFLGAFMKVQRSAVIDFKLINKLQQKYRIFHTLIEPTNVNHQSLILKQGYKVTSPYVPAKTIHIDLKLSESELLKQMHPKTRYNIKQAIKKGVVIKESDEITLFANFWKNIKFNRKFMGTREITELYKAFGEDAHLLLAYKGKELLAGVLNIHTKDISYYMYAVTSEEGKRTYAPTLVTWKSIKLAKKKKLKIYDFEGIYDERFPLESWQGFTRFKKGFGGKVVEYPGALSKVKLFGGR